MPSRIEVRKLADENFKAGIGRRMKDFAQRKIVAMANVKRLGNLGGPLTRNDRVRHRESAFQGAHARGGMETGFESPMVRRPSSGWRRNSRKQRV